MAERLKVYLDTSVISYLEQEDTPEHMAETRLLWQEFRKCPEIYGVYISEVTLDELDKAPRHKAEKFISYLKEIDYHLIRLTGAADSLAEEIIVAGILRRKSYDDCLHIAAAILADCDCIVSWNFKHLVNIKTINGIRSIALARRRRIIDIVSPPALLHYTSDEE